MSVSPIIRNIIHAKLTIALVAMGVCFMPYAANAADGGGVTSGAQVEESAPNQRVVFALANTDITSWELGTKQHSITIHMKPEKANELTVITGNHIGALMVFKVDGIELGAPRIRSAIDGTKGIAVAGNTDLIKKIAARMDPAKKDAAKKQHQAKMGVGAGAESGSKSGAHAAQSNAKDDVQAK